MKRLVIGGPEKYDGKFVDWPEEYDYFNVYISEPNRFRIFQDDEIYPTSPIFPSIHTYTQDTLITDTGERFKVWRSAKLDRDRIYLPPYVYTLLMDCNFWPNNFRHIKSRDAVLFQYKPFNEWVDLYEPIPLRKVNQLGFGFINELVQRLLSGKEFYKVERIDQTAKIGSGDS